jgi:aspartate aminotransferase
MAGISARAQKTQFSPIRKLKPLADQAIKAGKKIYNLNIGQPDIATPKAFMEGIKNASPILAYGPSQGLDEAVHALANYYERRNILLKNDEIIITTGGSEAISFALMAVCDPGDQVLVPEPFYTNYNSYATMANVEIQSIATSPDNGFALPSMNEIESRITSKTKAILFCSPGNPTGAVYSRKEMEMLAEIAKKYDLFLISDEVYREFVYDGLKHTSVMDLPDLEEHAILVDSISKRLSACGARIGTIVSKNREVMKAALKFAQARLCPPTLGQLGLIRFIQSPTYQQEIDTMIQKFESRRNVLFEEMQKIKGVFCRKPRGAFYLMPKLPVDDAEKFCAWLLTDFDLDGDTLLLSAAADFYQTKGKGRDEVRIAYVLNEDALKRSMIILGEALKSYAKKI